MRLYEDPESIELLREIIAEETSEMGNPVSKEDIWIDIPRTPNFKEGMQWPIKFYDEEEHKRLHDIFPVDGWVKAFSENKWQGYVFTWPKYRKNVYKASKKVFSENFNVKFNDISKRLCKFDTSEI